MTKVIEFSLTLPTSENPFALLKVSLKKFAALRSEFETLGLHVTVVNFK
jgi:hypothetical protein